MPTLEEARKIALELTMRLVDEGKIIEGGWLGYQTLTMNPLAPEIQKKECRLAFFAGAQHLFSSIMVMLDVGKEPTDKDMARISMIQSELALFLTQFKKEHGLDDRPTKFQG